VKDWNDFDTLEAGSEMTSQTSEVISVHTIIVTPSKVFLHDHG